MYCQVWLTSLVFMPAMVFAIDSTFYAGHSTPYTLGTFSAASCNFMYDPAVGDYYAAINSEQWNSALTCGRCAEVSSVDAAIAATVYIVDECPQCKTAGLGLSPKVLQRLNGDLPRHTIKWEFVDCPLRGSIEYCAHSLSNSSWLAVQPTNSITGVARMRIANQDVTMLDSGYYFLLQGESNIDMASVDIKLMSISGETITEKLSLTPGKCTAGTSNFGYSSMNSNNFDSLKSGSSYEAGRVNSADDMIIVTNTSVASSSSGTNLLLVAPVVLAAVGSIVAGAFAYVAKRKKLAEERKSVLSPFSVYSPPAILSDSLAKIQTN